MFRSIARCALAGSTLITAACAHHPLRLTPENLEAIRRVPVTVGFGADERASPDTLWQASASTDPFDGMLTARTGYAIVHGDATPLQQHMPDDPAWRGSLGAQRWTRSVTARLPTPVADAPLELEWQTRHERVQRYRGTVASSRTWARARWSRGPLRLELSPTGLARGDRTTCMFNVQLRGPKALPTDAQLHFSGQQCRRSFAGVVEEARLWSTHAQWQLGGGSTALSLTQLQYRNDHDGGSTALEVGAEHALRVGRWDFKGEIGYRPADEAEASAWGGRAQLRRMLWGMPVSLNWRRHQPELWSVESGPRAAHEASVGVDLSPHVQRWLWPGVRATLSYHQFVPDNPRFRRSEHFMLNMSFDW